MSTFMQNFASRPDLTRDSNPGEISILYRADTEQDLTPTEVDQNFYEITEGVDQLSVIVFQALSDTGVTLDWVRAQLDLKLNITDLPVYTPGNRVILGNTNPDSSTIPSNPVGDIAAGNIYFNDATKELWIAQFDIPAANQPTPTNVWLKTVDFTLPDMAPFQYGVFQPALFTDGFVSLWRGIRQSDIQPAFSVSMSGGQTVEIGTTIVKPSFTVNFSDAATAISFQDYGQPYAPVFPAPIDSQRNAILVSIGTFTKGAADVSGSTWPSISFSAQVTAKHPPPTLPVSASAGITWLPRRFWGVGLYSGNIVTLLATGFNSELAGGLGKSFTVTASPTQKIYYLIPVSYGTPTFSVGGFDGGFILKTTVPYVNTLGVSLSYNLWESEKLNLGTTTVSVR